jgi:hypothetical protein
MPMPFLAKSHECRPRLDRGFDERFPFRWGPIDLTWTNILRYEHVDCRL